VKLTNAIEKCKEKDTKAQQWLFQTYFSRLSKVAKRYLADEHEVEDITLITFMKVFESIGQFEFRHEGGFVSWMRKIAINECLMLLRKKNNFHLVPETEASDQASELDAVAGLGAEELMVMIYELPVGYRTIFNLYVIEGYNHKEIGELLSISENTSKSQLFKAKNMLRSQYERNNRQYGS